MGVSFFTHTEKHISTSNVCEREMKVLPKFVALGLCLVLYHLPRAEALNCYTSATDLNSKEECGMQTGCIKKFDIKTQNVHKRGCFLIPRGEECTTDDKTGEGVCYCTTDLCNASPGDLRPTLGLLLPLTAYLIIK